MNDDFKKRLWIGIGIIAGSMAISYALFSFLAQDIHSNSTKVVADKTAIQNQANEIANFASLETDEPKAAQYAAAIRKLLPDQLGLIDFNGWLAQIAQRYHTVATVSFQGDPVASTPTAPGTVNFTMTAQGSGGTLIPFMDYLASQATGFYLSFSSFDYANDGNQETVTAQGTLYFR